MTSRLSEIAAPLFDLNSTFSVVDVEATGQSTESHIIEIAIIRIENRKIVDSYQTLVRPPVGIPPFISKMTGIKSSDVADAPVFEEVADEIFRRLDTSFLVAHNVQFDYGCLKTEFLRLGRHFYMDRFCTVKLARKLLPGNRKYNLDAVCEKLGIKVDQRHRAKEDAWAAAQVLLHVLENEHAAEWLTKYGKTFDHREKWAERLELEIAKLPMARGVYVFRDSMGLPLYVGKSNNIRARIFSHLRDDRLPKKKRLFKYTEAFEAFPCGTELEALLLENRFIKELRPPYNIQQNHPDRNVFVRMSRDPYPKIFAVRERNGEDADYLGPFRSYRLVTMILEKAQSRFLLCPELMKPRRNKKGFCFSYHVQKCCGACGQAMPGPDYQKRVQEAAEWIETALSFPDEASIDKFLKNRSFKKPELQTVRAALAETKQQMKNTPEMFADCFMILDRKDQIGYLIRNGRLVKIFRDDQLEDTVTILETARLELSESSGPDESRVIQNFINNNRQRLELKMISL